jgi:hypothetical protein
VARSHWRRFTGMLIRANARKSSGHQPAEYSLVARSRSRNVTGMLIRANPRKASSRQPAEYTRERLRVGLRRRARWSRYP